MREEVKVEVVVLVFTQMGLCVLGTLLNNIVFITLRDLPGLRASTYNVMFCHLTFINLMIYTLVKPASAIYVSYAYALVGTGIQVTFSLVHLPMGGKHCPRMVNVVPAW